MISEHYTVTHTLGSHQRNIVAKRRILFQSKRGAFIFHIQSAFSRLNKTIEKHLQRQKLAKLTTEQLRDIGITRAQAIEEARKPFWR